MKDLIEVLEDMFNLGVPCRWKGKILEGVSVASTLMETYMSLTWKIHDIGNFLDED